MLWELARQVGQMVPKDLLLATVWADTVVSEGVLTACIRDVRLSFKASWECGDFCYDRRQHCVPSIRAWQGGGQDSGRTP